MSDKFNSVANRLAFKLKNSASQVPGLIVGLSGTDSIVAYLALYEACKINDSLDLFHGVHYVNATRRKPSWFEEHVVPWLEEKTSSSILVTEPRGGNQDPQRWADLHSIALEENYWVCGTMTATEWELGTYSMSANCVSLQPIRSLWKTDVMDICSELEVPAIAIENAQLPDCLCGRAELAAQNITLVDDILRNKIDFSKHSLETIMQVQDYIQSTKSDNSFKKRVPYIV